MVDFYASIMHEFRSWSPEEDKHGVHVEVCFTCNRSREFHEGVGSRCRAIGI
jgi:hypothetical protein